MNFNGFARPLYFFSFRMTFEFHKQKKKINRKKEENYFIESIVLSCAK